MANLALCHTNGREFCGRSDRHPFELYLQLGDIEHRTTKVNRPQSNGIVERFHRTLLDEHFRVEGRRTWFDTIDEMQVALNNYLMTYNWKRPHQGRGMNGRTPWQAFRDGLPDHTETSKMTEQEERKAARFPHCRNTGSGPALSGDHHLSTASNHSYDAI